MYYGVYLNAIIVCRIDVIYVRISIKFYKNVVNVKVLEKSKGTQHTFDLK